MKFRNSNGLACDFYKLCKAFIEGLAYCIILLTLAGCTVSVDKRSYSAIYLTPSTSGWSTSTVTITPSVTNASETQMEQAIDGQLSLPLIP